MIPVDRPYERVKDLARKDKSGYTDPDEYNRNLRDAQHILMSYYLDQLDSRQVFPENLNPFIKRAASIPIANGTWQRPADLRYVIEVFGGHIEAVGDCQTGTSTIVSYYQAHYAKVHEVGDRMTSPIRKPKKTSPLWFYEGDTIRFEPEGITHATVRYIKQPVDALYAYNLDMINDRLVFNPANSVNLEWLPQDEHNIIDLLLYMKGIETRDTALMQYAAGKRQLYGGVR